MKVSSCAGVVSVFAMLCCNSAEAAIRITEWMYQGSKQEPVEAGEFVELTNIGNAAIDMNGWSYNDDKQLPGAFDLSDFGIVAPGESVIFTDWNAQLFKNSWDIPGVKVIGLSAPGLGRNDEINIYDSNDTLVDRFTYGDSTNAPGSIRTRAISGNIFPADLGANNVAAAVLSESGDFFGSFQSARGEWGSPGSYPIPEPASAVILLTGSVLLFFGCRHCSAN